MALTLTPETRERSPREVQRQFEHYRRTGDPVERAALIEQHLPLARYLSRRYASPKEREDLEQVASLALVKAVDRYDPARGVAFSSYAMPTILGEIKRYFRDLGWTVRVPRRLQELGQQVSKSVEQLTAAHGRTPTAAEIAEHCDVSVEDVLEALQSSSAHFPDSLDGVDEDREDAPPARAIGRVDPELERAEQAVDVDRLLGTLSQRDALVLRLRFQHDLVQKDIATRMGISQMQVSRICRQAIEQLGDEASSTTS